MKFLKTIFIIVCCLLPFSLKAQVSKANDLQLLGELFYNSDTLNYRGVCFSHGLDSVPITADSTFAVFPVPHTFNGKVLKACTTGSLVAGDRDVTLYIRRIRSGTLTTMATISFTSDTDLTYTGGTIDTDYDDLATGDLIYPVIISSGGTTYRRILSVSLLFK